LSGCPVGVALLRKFRTRIEGLPQDVGEADANHPLAAFAGDPVGCVEEDEDAWEKFDVPEHLTSKARGRASAVGLSSEMGLIGLCRFLEYLVQHHRITGIYSKGSWNA